MKLGIIGNVDEMSFRIASQKGLDFVEFCVNVGNDPYEVFSDLTRVKLWMEEYSVRVGSIGRWGSDRLDPRGCIIQRELETSFHMIDIAAELGCNNFVCGCNYVTGLSYDENCAAAIEFLSKLIEYGKPRNVKISTYNCRWNSFLVDEKAWNIVHNHLKELGIKYDPSHCIQANGDYLKETKQWGSRFFHVHIKGSLVVGGEYVDSPPAGMDQTDWGAFMALLYAHGYNEGLSIEPHSDIWTGMLGDKGLSFTVRHIRNFIF